MTYGRRTWLTLALIAVAAGKIAGDRYVSKAEKASVDIEQKIQSITEVGNQALTFIKTAMSLTEVTHKRFLSLNSVNSELHLDFQNSNVTHYQSQIVEKLGQATDIYSKMIREMLEACFVNVDVFERFPSPLTLSQLDQEFYVNDSWLLLKDQIQDLNSMIKTTLSRKIKAYGHIDEAREKITSANGILVFAQSSFQQLSNAKLIELDAKQYENLKVSEETCWLFYIFCSTSESIQRNQVYTDEQKNAIQSRIKQFLKEVDDYMNWLLRTTIDLKKSISADEHIIAEIVGTVLDGESLLEKVNGFYQGGLTDEGRRYIPNFVNSLYNSAKLIRGASQKFLDENRQLNTIERLENDSVQ